MYAALRVVFDFLAFKYRICLSQKLQNYVALSYLKLRFKKMIQNFILHTIYVGHNSRRILWIL